MEINAGAASKFAFICYRLFLRIGTFQRVTGKGNKKISSMLRLAWRVVVATFQTAPAPVSPGSERDNNSGQRNIITNISVFVKSIRGLVPAIHAAPPQNDPTGIALAIRKRLI
jgi:hypothetical protein